MTMICSLVRPGTKIIQAFQAQNHISLSDEQHCHRKFNLVCENRSQTLQARAKRCFRASLVPRCS